MVHKCCVSVCGMSVRIPGAKGLSYHTFPAKEPNREKWIQAILQHVDKPESFRVVQGYTRVCSRHFKKKDYSMDSRKRARLSANAVPTVFPGKNSPILPPTKSSTSTKSRESSSRSTVQSMDPGNASLEFSQDELGNLTIETNGCLSSHTFESVEMSRDHLVLTLSEEETGSSSKFSSQESLQIPPEPYERENGKIRKRRKNRNELTRPASGPKKRSSSSTSDDLSVNVVGDALAEINLSTLISVSSSSDLQKELENILNEQVLNDSKSSDSSCPTLSHRKPAQGPRLTPVSFHEMPTYLDNAQRTEPAQIKPAEIEQDLLQSIQAVNLNSGEPNSLQTTIFVSSNGANPTSINHQADTSSSYSATSMPIHEVEPILPNEIQDMYADLVNGGASLSLEDSGLAIFDNQDLIEALQSASEGLELTTDIDQLARDLNASLLDGGALSSILDLDGIRISDIDNNSLHSSFDFGRDLMLSNFQEISDCVTATNSESTVNHSTQRSDNSKVAPSSNTAILKVERIIPEVPVVIKEELNSSSESDIKFFKSPKLESKSEASSPERSGKKPSKKEKGMGSFSVERFGDSDKDIEYYTGFATFAQFEVFYRSLDSYVENLKVTDMMHGVANLIQVPLPSQQETAGLGPLESIETPTEDKVQVPVQEEQKRRLSQGRSMTRIDELFMTIIRLKRKIPEKVLGHMFCISQPTVSRIIRAWTMLLSRVLELLPVEKGTTRRSSSSPASSSSHETVGDSSVLGIPRSFRQLFHSELAQSIIGSGTINSRKTSSSTSCPNVSRSKRPKKEKIIINVTEEISSRSSPLALSLNPEPSTSATGASASLNQSSAQTIVPATAACPEATVSSSSKTQEL